MKYKNPTTKKEYSGIDAAKTDFCVARQLRCKGCPLSAASNPTRFGCRIFSRAYPQKAAELMGLETEEEIKHEEV